MIIYMDLRFFRFEQGVLFRKRGWKKENFEFIRVRNIK